MHLIYCIIETNVKTSKTKQDMNLSNNLIRTKKCEFILNRDKQTTFLLSARNMNLHKKKRILKHVIYKNYNCLVLFIYLHIYRKKLSKLKAEFDCKIFDQSNFNVQFRSNLSRCSLCTLFNMQFTKILCNTLQFTPLFKVGHIE